MCLQSVVVFGRKCCMNTVSEVVHIHVDFTQHPPERYVHNLEGVIRIAARLHPALPERLCALP